MSEVLVLPDGRILAHNITPALAALLSELDPGNQGMQARAAALCDRAAAAEGATGASSRLSRTRSKRHDDSAGN